MRHRFAGRKFGRNPKHQRALMRMLAVSLFLTEQEDDAYFDVVLNKNVGVPKVKGRIITTIQKAKEVRPFVEKCITIAKNVLEDQRKANELLPSADRRTPEWKEWRNSEAWQEWNKVNAPVVAARRRLAQLLHNETAVKVIFDVIAPRFEDRTGGYTRILRLAKPRLGDAGTRAILEFVGKNDRTSKAAIKPSFDTEEAEGETTQE
ncbi:MAG: L17 family ribosomal protein [Planctomycetia bacterium]|nr:L17 family ribosomal protein [Planctomycetia bacterium]